MSLFFYQSKSNSSIKNFFSLIRIEQWTKNLFVLLPAFFAAKIGEQGILAAVLLAALSFCAMASAVYVLNDLRDVEADRQHPEKRKRAIASGAVSVGKAKFVGVLFLIAAIALSVSLSVELTGILLAYLMMNLAYSFGLRSIALLDITIISLGFLLRVFAGGVVVAIPISHWLIVLTFLLALLLALGKRRAEFVNQSETVRRASLSGYNLPFIDGAMTLLGAVTVVAYLMYTITPEVTGRIGSAYVYLTSFFVVMGILRYLQLAIVFGQTEAPTKVLLKDRFLQAILLGWGILFAYLLYF